MVTHEAQGSDSKGGLSCLAPIAYPPLDLVQRQSIGQAVNLAQLLRARNLLSQTVSFWP